MMKREVRYQKQSEMVKCDFCQREMRARGLKSHLRLTHNLRLTDVTTVKGPVTTVTADVLTTVTKDSEPEIVIVEKSIEERTYTPFTPQSLTPEQNRLWIMRTFGLPDTRPSTQTIRKENDEWLNSSKGKEYMANYHAEQEKIIEKRRDDFLKSESKKKSKLKSKLKSK